MQTSVDAPWFREEEPETIELSIGIEGEGCTTHEIPIGLLEQEFDTDEQRCEYIEEVLNDMALRMSVQWRDNQ